MRRTLLSILSLSLLAGCAGLGSSTRPRGDLAPSATACGQWLAAVDRAVADAGVADAAGTRVPGFPYLRVNRFIASFDEDAARDPRRFEEWSAAARALDREGRAIELRNLPPAALASLGAGSLAQVQARTEACAIGEMRAAFATPATRELALQRARVPDDYVQANRVLGLYPVTRLAFERGVEHWHDEAIAAFTRYSRGERAADASVRYGAPGGDALSAAEVARLIAARSTAPLGRLELSGAEEDALFRTFAPVFEVETGGDFDRIGAVSLDAGAHPRIDTAAPTVYRRLAYTRFGGEVLPQLVYTAWFPERPRDSALDILAGRLDGAVFRVTLGRDGAPLVYDAIHPCGCYHMFFPTARLKPRPARNPGDEWAFIPSYVPPARPGERVILHLQSRTHYLTGISVSDAAGARAYAIRDEDGLRSLAAPDGRRRSLYGPDGLVAGSERIERFLFWPMGVPSAGTMRQWGHHATAFLGTRHFDDADLIAQRFEKVAN